MKKQLLLLSAAAVMSAISASAEGHWTLQDKAYTVDTLFHAKIGPGTTQTSLSLKGGSNLKIFYITTDLTDPNVDIRVAQAGSKLTGGAKLSAMSNANTDAATGIEYFAGVNADFFGNSQPIGASVVNGDVWKAPGTAGWVSFYMNDSKVPGIELLNYKGTATCGDASHAVTGINMGRGENNLIVFNTHFGANTGTNAYGTEVVLSCDKTIGYNGIYECTVMGTPVGGAGSMSIPSNQYVLSGHGTASTFVAGLKSGDKVTLNLNTELATGGIATQVAGGQPIILQNGVTLNTQNALDHLVALNPRTAVGYNADRTKLVLLVVDGRNSGGSAGVVSKVLADIMREVGCSDAMNFDGGGSSELFTRPFGVRNVPSDGSERTVVNSVWAVATAPADRNVGELAFTAPSISLPKYGYYSPTIYAYNQYGVMLSTDFKDYTLSCPAELGEIVNGNVLFANGSGTHTLTATYNGVSTEIQVTVGSAEPRARLRNVIVDGYRTYPVEVVAEVEGKDMAIDNSAFQWSIDNTDVATVDQAGVVSGVANGSATVTAKVENYTVTLPVTVQKPKTHYIDIVGEDISDWTVSKSGLSTATLSKLDKGLAVDYKISSTRGTNFSIKPADPIVLYALPDSIRLVVNPGSGVVTKVTLAACEQGGRAVQSSQDVNFTQNAANVVTFPISDFIDTKDMANYPVTFTQLYFYIGGSTGDEVHFEIPTLTTVHAAVAGTDGVKDVVADSRNEVKVLDRNVVSRGEVVELIGANQWTVYSVNGAIIARGDTSAIDTGAFTPGIYIVSTSVGSSRLVIR